MGLSDGPDSEVVTNFVCSGITIVLATSWAVTVCGRTRSHQQDGAEGEACEAQHSSRYVC